MERVPVDAYVIDTLMPDLVSHDHRPSAFLVFLYLWRRTAAASRKAVASAQMISDGTGLSKRAVQTAIQTLVRRRLVEVKRTSATATPAFGLVCHWRDR